MIIRNQEKPKGILLHKYFEGRTCYHLLLKESTNLTMKFMKIGTKPDTFYTEEATRTVISDAPSDFVIQINNIHYLLHKFPLLPKCGLLQRLCSDSGDLEKVSIKLHDIPGGEDAFEMCAKFCYGITINLSAYNFVPAFCAAKFLRMTESVEKGNFVPKLEAFFNLCILEGWKDSITALQTTVKLPEWSENLGIIRKCIDSIVEKILTPPAKVAWSYTYTRPGYTKKQHHSVPKDWWTEDISDLDVDLFRCIITAVRATHVLPPQLIGEALHVYACRWLPDTTRTPPQTDEELMENNRRIVDSVVSMIPGDKGAVSVGFLLRLTVIANYLRVSPATKTDLLRRSGLQLEEATVDDLIFPSNSPADPEFYNIDLVLEVLESFLVLWRRQSPAAASEWDRSAQVLGTMRKVGKLIDSYLQVVARDVNMPVSKVVSLAEALPDIAREDHDGIYKAINIYLKEHGDLSKADRKRLCRILDCQKLSPEVRAHAVKNERLPLRTVVQVLFFEQERDRGSNSKAAAATHDRHKHKPLPITPSLFHEPGKQTMPSSRESDSQSHKLKLGAANVHDKFSSSTTGKKDNPLLQMQNKRSGGKLALKNERKGVRLETQQVDHQGHNMGREIVRGGASGSAGAGSKLDAKKMIQRGSRPGHGHDKGKDR